MNNKTLLLTLSFTLGTLFTNAQSLSGFQWGKGMGTPDLFPIGIRRGIPMGKRDGNS